MYLFQEFFYEKDPRRLEEYVFCIQQNIKLPFVKKNISINTVFK